MGREGVQVLIRGQGTSEELLAIGQQILRDLDPDMAVIEAKTMNEHLALTLAAIGIYGVVSHAVPRRTRELGIRMSLGATARDVVRMAISGFLFGVQPNDVATFIAIPALLSSVALFAAWIPARRASRIDPVRALPRE